ncbi:phosphate/phosphite/phosphonate ABC transporter substrate-binding protein [Geomonas nitrogeniifigens]|uniref:Phosphate/phosphite/phosphonate ABC transporter substrate-binding protein n=1 Tax=Geomonas diazotrophica TaxID=2843197 RepID=A0ABX8JF67_9BACT|nr:phosphate/phosphite/phosphonate ABC transporter substrate-binding protein [Geomonas nitrogeniifigens]QWV96122.1 phosphate/phosphite/phosphonate ABC transporter substrate-binding protein [Geomonas nitrogeniifigens]QXE85189.1 phosphate/phosphite/phosphonate ABC transporter substrate-binding protein [Geomonas nitrogeniifigens]
MRSIIRLFGLVLFLALFPGVASAQGTFVIGVAPHTSARVILEMYQPLRLYLGKSLNMPVEVVTAPDFDEFARRALAQKYDLAITTGHQARLLQVDAGYLPQLTYKADFKAVTIVPRNSDVTKPADLKGRKVLGLSAASLVTLWGEHWLAENHVASLPVKFVSASDSVAQLLLTGEAAAGFTSLANFQKLRPEVQGQLRIIAQSAPLAGRVYLLNQRWSAREKAINAALWTFAETAEGKRYFDTNKLGGYRKLHHGELEGMDHYAAEVKRLLKKEER